MGMCEDELNHALHVAYPPKNTSGRSKYGMGLKTAACWIGNYWSIKTKKLGESIEHNVTVDVAQIASGISELSYSQVINKNIDQHYTVIEIKNHNRKFQGRTLGKIPDFIRSMYREDFRNKILDLSWQGEFLSWEEYEDRLLVAPDNTKYKKEFEFEVNQKRVRGWVGILDRGSRADAGFSIIHCGRVIRGWPETWRPQKLYGQIQGSNDLVNQRLVGEIHLDDFDVSHTKDDILWLGDEEDEVETKLYEYCADYRDLALRRRKKSDDERGPSQIEVSTALDEFQKELTSKEMIDAIALEIIPPQQVVNESTQQIIKTISNTQEATFKTKINDLNISLYLTSDTSPTDYYLTVDATNPPNLIVVISMSHPHWSQLQDSEGVLNYLRDCTYDAVAEWQARYKAARIDPDTIKILKDRLLRVPFELEQHESY